VGGDYTGVGVMTGFIEEEKKSARYWEARQIVGKHFHVFVTFHNLKRKNTWNLVLRQASMSMADQKPVSLLQPRVGNKQKP
jgi:hypothetical protein